MSKGKRHAWDLPRDAGKLVLRELGAEELDDLAIQAARRMRDDPIASTREQHRLALIRSLVAVGSRRVSAEFTSEELYHSLTRRDRKLARTAWRAVHQAGDDLVDAVLATCEPVDGRPGAYRWQLNPDEVLDLEIVANTLGKQAANPPEGTDADTLQEAFEEADAAVEAARTRGELVLREVLVGEIDRLGDDAARQHADDPWRRMSAEQRDAIAASFVSFRGVEVGDGAATYRGLDPIERDLVQRCWHQINDVDEAEVVAFLGSREAKS
jgi:hypothetical protein